MNARVRVEYDLIGMVARDSMSKFYDSALADPRWCRRCAVRTSRRERKEKFKLGMQYVASDGEFRNQDLCGVYDHVVL
jgi:hypothetical protein